MKAVDRSNNLSNLLETRNKIEAYLKSLTPHTLDIEHIGLVEVLEISHGTYNVNYRVRMGGKDFIFRINIEQQSGLLNQIEYEFKAMRFLEGLCIAPQAFYMDSTRQHFEFDILIEEYLDGPHARLTEAEMPEAAGLLARLHSIPTAGLPLMNWSDPLSDNYQLVRNDLIEYEAKASPDPQVIRLSRDLLFRLRKTLDEHGWLFSPDGLNHTDVAIDNFIRTPLGLRLIDWEKPRIDDCTYDICCFLCEPAQLWCTPEPLSRSGREVFLKTYLRLSGKDEALFMEKVRLREPFVSLHWILWGANKLCDLRDRRTANELQQVHQLKVERWERMVQPQNLEKILELL